MNKVHAAAYAIELAKAIDHTANYLEFEINRLRERADRIRKQPNNSVIVFEQGYGALGEIAELNRAARAETVARAYGTAMHFAERK
jgi:hypothetical protein